jgi:hypothetical protein
LNLQNLIDILVSQALATPSKTPEKDLVPTETAFQDQEKSSNKAQPPPKKNFSLTSKLGLVEVLAVQPHLSPQKFQLRSALVVQAFLQEARNNGIERLDDLVP